MEMGEVHGKMRREEIRLFEVGKKGADQGVRA